MIAIATNKADKKVSETFIQRHIREIAPGQTAVIVVSSRPTVPDMDCPTHTATRPDRSGLRWPIRKAAGLYKLLLEGFSGALCTEERNRLTAFLDDCDINTIMAEYGPPACAIRRACAEAGAEMFVHFHGYDASKLPRKWRVRHAYRRLLFDVAGIICPSRFLADKLVAIGLPEQKMHVIPCGVDTDQFVPAEKKDPNLILAVGRFTAKKAPHHTVQAFGRIADDYPGVRLEMIGDGELFGRCKDLAGRLGITDRIVFHGAREHSFVQQKMARAAVFVQHSVTAETGDTEGLGVSLLEAMSSGTPVVATRHNGFVETVSEGETGFLVDEHDVDGMAEKIRKLCENRELRQSMGEDGRKRVIANFSADKEIRDLRSLMGIHVEQ